MKNSIQIMQDEITTILEENNPTIYLFGSITLNDFKLGWSDIDIVCFCEKALSINQAETLVHLRQHFMSEYVGNPYFRLFEGGFITWDAFLNQAADHVVYWGTSGERITDTYNLDSFSTIELKTSGVLLYGTDRRTDIIDPCQSDIIKAVEFWYTTIRKYAQQTSKAITSAGWLLDIARCLYTLETNTIIAKTDAGEWAIKNNLVPNIEIMQKAIEIRKEPIKAINDERTLEWCADLGPYIQEFADVLEEHINIKR